MFVFFPLLFLLPFSDKQALEHTEHTEHPRSRQCELHDPSLLDPDDSGSLAQACASISSHCLPP